MPVNRRFFLQKTIGVLCYFGTFAYGVAPLLSRRLYVFKISMKTDKDFSKPDTRFWENRAGLEEINGRYSKSGKLLALKEVKDEKSGTITWLYMFDNKQSFKDWDREVLSSRLFERDNIPAHVAYRVEEFPS